MKKRKGNPIGWCTDTWNPIVGCSKISPGCAHCYAETMAIRLAAMGQEKYKQAISPRSISQGAWPGPDDKYGWNGSCYLSESELEKPFHWKQPRRIFVSSMGDLFHENNSFENIDRVMRVVADCFWHTFLILTKRAERMAAYFKYLEKLIQKWNPLDFIKCEIPSFPFTNLHLGVTAENQETADLRIPILLQIPAALRFVSIEPMLGPVELEEYFPQFDHRYEYGFFQEFQKACGEVPDGKPVKIKDGLDWVILGMETGHGARTFPGAAEAIVKVKDQCQEAGVPFFYKGPQSIGAFRGVSSQLTAYYLENRKKDKEYLIDGVEYRQFPEAK